MRTATTPAFIAAIVAAFAIGAWSAQVTGRDLGAADHGSIVIDEVAAFLLVLFFVGAEPLRITIAFLLFRAFDIAIRTGRGAAAAGPREIAQAGSGEVPREDQSAPFPIGGIKQFEDLIWSEEATTRLGGSWTSGALGIAAEGNIDLAGISI